MIKMSLSEARTRIAKVAGSCGMSVNDTRLTDLINVIQQRLIDEDDWPWMEDRIRFCNYQGCIALPPGYDVALKIAVDRSNKAIANNWYEFVSNGPGHQDTTDYAWIDSVIERGEAPVVRQPGDTAQTVRVYGLVDERDSSSNNAVLRVMGYDSDERWVRTQDDDGNWIDGEDIDIVGHSATNYTDSTITYSKITQIVKPRTNGNVELFYKAADASLSFAGRYTYKETNPSYRLYTWPIADSATWYTVHALCRRRFHEAVDDNDQLFVTNLSALRNGVMAVHHEESDRFDLARAHWETAIHALVREAQAWRGETVPAIDTSTHDGFGFESPY